VAYAGAQRDQRSHDHQTTETEREGEQQLRVGEHDEQVVLQAWCRPFFGHSPDLGGAVSSAMLEVYGAMRPEDFDARIQRLADTLAQLLDGHFDGIDLHGEIVDDALGRIEETVQFLVLDSKTVSVAHREKEAALLLQQDQLATKIEQLEQQRIQIQLHERELAAKARTIAQQTAAIRELSTPILEVWEDVLVLPIIGAIDTARSETIMVELLAEIQRMQTKWVILDITGVELVDTQTADHLIKVVRAASLLGCSSLLCGVQPAVAQTLVGIGVELLEIATARTLKNALRHCLIQMRGTP
jgi:rsbT co-antagonist protein RsbR